MKDAKLLPKPDALVICYGMQGSNMHIHQHLDKFASQQLTHSYNENARQDIADC